MMDDNFVLIYGPNGSVFEFDVTASIVDVYILRELSKDEIYDEFRAFWDKWKGLTHEYPQLKTPQFRCHFREVNPPGVGLYDFNSKGWTWNRNAKYAPYAGDNDGKWKLA